MAWLITGGAGYIGAHVVRDMQASERSVVVLDDLSTGRADRLPRDVPLVKADVGNRRAVRRVLAQHEITGVMHFAARKQVGESVARPLHYWGQNVGGLQVLLEEMVDAGINQMVFSSSAAVYGQPDLTPGGPGISASGRITENAPCAPINPYGATKLSGEWMVAGTAEANAWHAISLRYFNVAGAGSPVLGDPAALNLIPMILEALDQGRRPQVFGDDYPTPDGTGVRDYIHVVDLARGHLAALDKLRQSPGVAVYNLGTGRGYSVLEMVAAFERASGRPIPYEIVARRAGDIAACYADPTLAREEIGWQAELGIDAMVADTWRWQSRNPNGYI